ncbi:hypothetical protein ACTXMF_10695 [Psychrobacter celer]|uniref:hypothetical protein n=1 Tax=Psychrobacter celer TaxID=306572 RepID=UPI003FCF9459
MKITKSELLRRIEALEEWASGADEMLTELNHALPDPEYDAKCEADESAISASLDRHRERLGLNKPQPEPKPKQLDQSVFDGKHSCLHFAFVNKDGSAMLAEVNPITHDGENFNHDRAAEYEWLPGVYDTTNWQNSLIERDIAKELLEVDLSSELTGSELCKAMLARGDVCVPCFVAWDSDAEAIADKSIWLVHEFLPEAPNFHAGLEDFYCAVPINTRTGEPLTASEVGL